jgi:hypothetical protein
MRYQPVKVVHVIHRAFSLRESTHVLKERTFYQARSKNHNCGHEHKTEAAAAPCRARMQKQWTQRRSALSKAAARKRNALRGACVAMKDTMPVTTALVRMANGF